MHDYMLVIAEVSSLHLERLIVVLKFSSATPYLHGYRETPFTSTQLDGSFFKLVFCFFQVCYTWDIGRGEATLKGS